MHTIKALAHYEREVEIQVTDAELALLKAGEGPGYDALDERITHACDETPKVEELGWIGTTVVDEKGDELWTLS